MTCRSGQVCYQIHVNDYTEGRCIDSNTHFVLTVGHATHPKLSIDQLILDMSVWFGVGYFLHDPRLYFQIQRLAV